MMELSSVEEIIARLLVDLAIRKTSIPYSEREWFVATQTLLARMNYCNN